MVAGGLVDLLLCLCAARAENCGEFRIGHDDHTFVILQGLGKANVSGLLFRTVYLGLFTMTASVCCISLTAIIDLRGATALRQDSEGESFNSDTHLVGASCEGVRECLY